MFAWWVCSWNAVASGFLLVCCWVLLFWPLNYTLSLYVSGARSTFALIKWHKLAVTRNLGWDLVTDVLYLSDSATSLSEVLRHSPLQGGVSGLCVISHCLRTCGFLKVKWSLTHKSCRGDWWSCCGSGLLSKLMSSYWPCLTGLTIPCLVQLPESSHVLISKCWQKNLGLGLNSWKRFTLKMNPAHPSMLFVGQERSMVGDRK